MSQYPPWPSPLAGCSPLGGTSVWIWGACVQHSCCVMDCARFNCAHQSASLMSPASIGGVGSNSVGAGLVPVPSALEISCPQVWSPLARGRIGERRNVPGGSCRGTASSAVKLLPAVKNYLMSNSARPLFLPSQIGADPWPICNRVLSSTIYPLVHLIMSSCGGIVSTVESGVEGPPSRTPSADQQPADWTGYRLGQYWRWGPLTRLVIGPGSVSGPPPSPVSAPGWREEGTRRLVVSATTSHLTTSGPWKRVNSTLHPFGRPRMTSPTPPCTLPDSVVIASNHTTS